MDNIFTTLLTLSWQAGVIALAVALVRLPLRRAPRWAVCALWALVALRLLLPVTLESPVSLQAEEAPPIRAYHAIQQRETDDADTPVMSAPKDTPAVSIVPGEVQTATHVSGGEPVSLTRMLPWIWLTGVGCMLLYMALSCLRMWAKVRKAPHLYSNVYHCGDFGTPFVLGLFSPRIYLPDGLPEDDLPQVLSHERCHIRRGDHIVKPLAFLLLALHWFNPALWLAYVLLGRDMERACDEMVLKNATPIQRAAYSRALVACAAQPKMAAVCPLAFGEVAVKERVKNVLNYKKPALWAVILLVVAAAIIGVCLLTKPAENDAGVPDAETLYALRTEYIGDNSAVSGILDALGFRAAGAAGDGQAYTYSFEVETASEPYGVVVRYAFAGALPQRSAEWNRQMAQRGYIALALIDNAEWLRWEDIGAEGETPVSGTVYAGDYVAADYNAVRGSAAGLQALMDTLQACLEDGSIVYYEGDAQPSFEETMPWSVTGDNDPCSVRAEDYGIVYDAAQLPDWETVPLSYLCAYYLNGDGAYAEGAMDVLAQRYSQLPQQVRRYIRTLSGQADPRGNGDAAEALLRDISRYITSQLTGGLPVTVSYEKDQLSIAVTEVYSVVYRTVKYDENYSEDIPVYEVGSGAQLSVIKGEGFTLYGRYTSENRLLHDGEVIDLAQAYTGIGMDGLYNVQFRYIDRTEAARQDTLTFNDNGAGLVSYPAAWYSGSGYSICILADGWHRLTPMDGWNDATVDGSPVLNGKSVEVWESTEDIFARLYVAHLGAMTLKEAQDWAIGAAGSSFALIESKQGDMSGTDGTGNQDWTAAFRGSDTERFAVIKTYPVAQTEHLGYALNAMADTFTVQ